MFFFGIHHEFYFGACQDVCRELSRKFLGTPYGAPLAIFSGITPEFPLGKASEIHLQIAQDLKCV